MNRKANRYDRAVRVLNSPDADPEDVKEYLCVKVDLGFAIASAALVLWLFAIGHIFAALPLGVAGYYFAKKAEIRARELCDKLQDEARKLHAREDK